MGGEFSPPLTKRFKMIVKEISKKVTNKVSPAERDKMIKEQRAKDEKMVKGMFEFIDAQGGFLEFGIRLWPGEPIRSIHLTHGEICDLPMGIVRHLNNTRKKVRRYTQEIAPDGKRPLRTFDTISRVRFTPTDYL